MDTYESVTDINYDQTTDEEWLKYMSEHAPYGYVVCRKCGYERVVGIPCGEPCV